MKFFILSNKLVLIILAGWVTIAAHAQTTQTIRGTITDNITQTPLIGVNIKITTVTDNALGSATDVNGNYRIDQVPLGRHTVHITYVGYEEQLIPNVVVTAGKEVILNISLTESISQLEDVVVIADTKDDKTATNNDLAVVSARSFNVDDTKRYAGALGDPSRMVANFAGVIGGDDSRNDIVVRGNSPTGMLWQVEGLNIPNPNHFGSLNSTGGPVSMLNNNNIDKSDFITSAFPSQYGNALAGVFDIRLREGNNEKTEYTGQIGFNGFEVGAEGRMGKNGGSFIANYRYSTLGIFDALGIDFGTGSNVPLYQDLNFKLTLPTKGNGKWSIFGIAGKSKIDLLGSEADLSDDSNLYGSENEDAYPAYQTGIVGVSYEKNLSNKTFAKITAGISTTEELYSADSLVRNEFDEVTARFRKTEASFETRKISLTGNFRTKLNAKNSLAYGFYLDALRFDLFNRELYPNISSDTIRIDVADNSFLSQGYLSWKHRFNPNFSFVAGVHTQHYSLNSQFVAEPRITFQYMINGKQSLSIGYGLHHQMQNAYTNYVQTKTESGYIYTNTGLDFTASQHAVLTYDWNITDVWRLKAETYYQQISDVPVERDMSSFSAINVGSSFAPSNQDSLVSTGTGRNYGVELTLERFFSKGFYFLLTTSIFDSQYKGSDGIQRNTAYNTQYVANGLAGKEWRVGRNKNFFSVSLKVTTIGGKYLTPINREASQQLGQTIYDEANAYSEKQDPYFRTDIKLAYRKEYKKSSLEIALDLQNVTNNQNIFSQSYNPRTNQVVTQYQQGFFPVPFVRYTF